MQTRSQTRYEKQQVYTVDIDFETQPIGLDSNGNGVFLRDIWPTRQ
jgi:aconitase A